MMKSERELRRTAEERGYEVLGTATKSGIYDLRHRGNGALVRCRAPNDSYKRALQDLDHRLRRAAETGKDPVPPHNRVPVWQD